MPPFRYSDQSLTLPTVFDLRGVDSLLGPCVNFAFRIMSWRGKKGGGKRRGNKRRSNKKNVGVHLKPVTLKPVIRIFRIFRVFVSAFSAFSTFSVFLLCGISSDPCFSGVRVFPHFLHFPRLGFESLISKIRPTGFNMTGLGRSGKYGKRRGVKKKGENGGMVGGKQAGNREENIG